MYEMKFSFYVKIVYLSVEDLENDTVGVFETSWFKFKTLLYVLKSLLAFLI